MKSRLLNEANSVGKTVKSSDKMGFRPDDSSRDVELVEDHPNVIYKSLKTYHMTFPFQW